MKQHEQDFMDACDICGVTFNSYSQFVGGLVSVSFTDKSGDDFPVSTRVENIKPKGKQHFIDMIQTLKR